ncbi:MAG: SPOR domain-containing protein [Acidobacteria bacterium]|nr:SPOR domain-containing protein [Acidobacteriota bacterium]
MGVPGEVPEKVVEFRLDLVRGSIIAAVALLALGAAFLAGRASAPAARGASPAAPPPASRAASGVEDVGASETVFDRAEGEARRPGRQVTSEPAQGGAFELDLGATPDRAGADRLRAQAASRGIPASVARDAQGRYRVVAGPFASESEARGAATRLAPALGRTPVVRSRRAP